LFADGSSNGRAWPPWGRLLMRATGRLKTRRRAGVRPTQARVRDALLNSLGPRIAGARVLDLYAGTGALGMGALDHGAAYALFVERQAALAAALRRRLTAEGMSDRAEVWAKDALAAVRDLGGGQGRFDIILMDPPYGGELIAVTLDAITRAGILAPAGLVAAEGHWRDHPGETAGFVCSREARYGETRLWYFQHSGGESP